MRDIYDMRVRVGMVACLFMLSVVAGFCAEGKSAWDHIRVFRQGGEGGPAMYAEFEAINALVAMGDEAVGPLVSVLDRTSKFTRASAARALGRIGAKEAVEPLMVLLGDEEPDVRSAAAEALGLLGDKAAAGTLIRMLGSEEEMDVRGAIVGLGRLKCIEAIAPLTELLESKNWEIRWRAAVALGQIGDKSAALDLAFATRDESVVASAAARWAFGQVIGAPDGSGFVANLSNKDAGIVYGSAWALGVIGDAAAVDILGAALMDEYATSTYAAGDVLLWLGSDAAMAWLDQAEAVHRN